MSHFSPNNIFTPTPLSPIRRFLLSPIHFLAHWLYTHQPPLAALAPGSPPITLVCISDTHNKCPVLPGGDILLHAGDMTINGTPSEVQAQVDWLNSLPHTHKVAIAGNHDACLSQPECAATIAWGAVRYLENASTRVHVRGRTLSIHGAPQTQTYGNWPFQYAPGDADAVWRGSVPLDTDILLTHGPARGHGDGGAGCGALLREVRRVGPRVSVCGHVHCARGVGGGQWGGVDGGWDEVNLGEGGGLGLGRMVGEWVWAWVKYLLGGKRRGEVLWVNAAMREGRDGEEGWVVEI